VIHELYSVNTSDEGFQGKDQLMDDLREEFIDGPLVRDLDVRCCGLLIMTSESPINIDPDRGQSLSHAIVMSLTAPEAWFPSGEMDCVTDCIFNMSDVEIPEGETVQTHDVRDALEAEAPSGMIVYGPMLFCSDAEITMYKGGIDGPDPDFDSVGRRMCVSLILDSSIKDGGDLANLPSVLSLLEYVSGQCDACGGRDHCPQYASLREIFPFDDASAMAEALKMLNLLVPGMIPAGSEDVANRILPDSLDETELDDDLFLPVPMSDDAEDEL
jgi:hypothetical protein